MTCLSLLFGSSGIGVLMMDERWMMVGILVK
jgi:hypothetical protein